jgi:hypothetical protein
MPRKIIFPLLMVLLVIPGCNIQSISPTSTPEEFKGTAVQNEPTSKPVITPFATETTASTGNLSLDILRNSTYITPYYNRTVTLINGNYSEGSGSNIFSVQFLDVYGLGDLNGDGKDDAAILLAESSGGSGVFESFIAIINQDGIPHQESQVMLGDRVKINSLDITSGVIHLDMVNHGPTDPMCCPSQAQNQDYWLIGTKLWLLKVTSTIGGTVHLIDINTPANWATVSNPFIVSGTMTILPFENTLADHIYLIDGTEVNSSSFTVTPSGDTAATFSHDFDLSSAGITVWVILQFLDVSAADGSTIALGSVILKPH